MSDSAAYQTYHVCLAKRKREGKPFDVDGRQTCRAIAYDVWLSTGGLPMRNACTALPEPELDHLYRC